MLSILHRKNPESVLHKKTDDSKAVDSESRRFGCSKLLACCGITAIGKRPPRPDTEIAGKTASHPPRVAFQATVEGGSGSPEGPSSGSVGEGHSPLRMCLPERESRVTLVYDSEPRQDGAMRFFRTTNHLDPLAPRFDRTGMAELRISGSERISSNTQLQRIREQVGAEPLVVVDLRQESHAVAGDYPITWRGPMDWANVGMSQGRALQTEAALIERLRQQSSITIVHADYIKGKTSDPQELTLLDVEVKTERDMVEAAGGIYQRLALIDHVRPSRADVDQFIDLVRSLPDGAALHVHCNGGRGRTTTFMTMYDILRNADKMDVEKIIDRQSALGYDYNMTDVAKVPEHKRSFFKDRLAFLKEFHEYARQNLGGWPLKWSEWRRSHANSDSIEATGPTG
ncbi:MAG TPA: phosphatase [Burkholderiaceae bacterium]|nr:phosphatase [Burkholderiaceae bacterium]